MLATVTCPLASTTTPVFTNPSSMEEFPVTVSTIFEYIRYVPRSNLMSYVVLSAGLIVDVLSTPAPQVLVALDNLVPILGPRKRLVRGTEDVPRSAMT